MAGWTNPWVRWVEHVALDRGGAQRLNFTERGFGVRAALGVTTVGTRPSRQLKPGISIGSDFGKQGARWFHTGAVFSARFLRRTPEVTLEPCSQRGGTERSFV